MSTDPFKPASGNGSKPDAPGAALRAVMIGLAVDIGGSTLIGIVLSLVYASQLAAGGMSQADVEEAVKAIPSDSAVAIIGTLLGACCSVAGGFVCARLARRNEYRVGAIMASLSALFDLLTGPADIPDDLLMLFTLSTFACVMLGVKYGHELNARARTPENPPAGTPQP